MRTEEIDVVKRILFKEVRKTNGLVIQVRNRCNSIDSVFTPVLQAIELGIDSCDSKRIS